MTLAAERMIEIHRVLLFATIVAVWLWTPYHYWKIYKVYKLLGDCTGNLGFFWFSFQFQHPVFSKGMRSYLDYFDGLPDELKARVLATRSELRRHVLAFLLWIALLLAFGWLTSRLERHQSILPPKSITTSLVTK
jgi:hypothetical protein